MVPAGDIFAALVQTERSQGLSLIVPALITQNSGVSKIDQHADQHGEDTTHIPPPRCLAIMKSLETPAQGLLALLLFTERYSKEDVCVFRPSFTGFRC
jgi:hypothetical protein